MNPFQPPAELTQAVRRLRDAQHQRVHLSVAELTAIHTTMEQFRHDATGAVRRWLDEHHAAYVTSTSPCEQKAATDQLAHHFRLCLVAPSSAEYEQLVLFDFDNDSKTLSLRRGLQPPRRTLALRHAARQ